MSCHDFEINVLALARGQLLDAAIREQSLAHTKDCARCANRLIEEQALIAGVRVVVENIASEAAPARIKTTLLAAFREHVSAYPSPAIVGTRRRPLWGLVAAAAMILILISATAIFLLQSRSLNQIQEVMTVRPVPTHALELERIATKREPEIASEHKIPRQPRPVHRRVPAHRSSDSEEVTEFFQLMEGVDLNSPEEVVQVVRVELSPSELADVLTQTGHKMAAKPIKADVILGQDGLARAIRFVR